MGISACRHAIVGSRPCRRDGRKSVASVVVIASIASAINRLILFPSAPPEPIRVKYWFLMQFATIVGFATSDPANWWLVKSGIKEAM